MNSEDQRAIEDLFAKLKAVEGQAGPRDRGAEAFIDRSIAAQPAAPYYMAQTIIVQNQALEQARRRIEELEGGDEARPGRIFSGIFGGGGRTRGSVPPTGRRAAPPPPEPAGGGFLAGAAQTAMGVAGGVLLGNLIGGMLFGGHSAEAAESDRGNDGDDDQSGDDSDFDGGGDFGGDFGGGDF